MNKNIYLDKKNGIVLKQGIPDLSKYKLSKIVRRNNSPFFNSFMRIGSTLKNPELDFDSRMNIHIVLDHDIYHSEDEFTELKKRMVDKAKEDDTFLDRYLAKAVKDSKDFIEWSKNQKDFPDLLKFYNEFTERTLKVMTHLWPALGPEEWILSEIEKGLARYIDPKTNFDEFKSVLNLLTSSNDISDINLRRIAMMKSKNLKKVHEKYAWLGDQSFSLVYESFDDFKKELSSIKNPKQESERIESDIKQLKENQKKAIKKYKLDKKLLKFCEYAQNLPHIRLLRRDCLIESGYNLKRFFDKLKKELPLSNITLAYYWEIRDLLEGKKLDLNSIEKRKETYSFIVIGNYFYEYDPKTASEIKKKIESSLDLTGEIKGQTACMGKITGKVRVLHSAKEINKVKKGDILVTSMTTPDYVPAMEKAAAFVTDEGGLSCHAAIVAREMKKPCVIGTKIATKVLKDDDLVEVDANKGTVKKIN